MDETVPLLGHRPWVVKTMGRYTYWLTWRTDLLKKPRTLDLISISVYLGTS